MLHFHKVLGPWTLLNYYPRNPFLPWNPEANLSCSLFSTLWMTIFFWYLASVQDKEFRWAWLDRFSNIITWRQPCVMVRIKTRSTEQKRLGYFMFKIWGDDRDDGRNEVSSLCVSKKSRGDMWSQGVERLLMKDTNSNIRDNKTSFNNSGENKRKNGCDHWPLVQQLMFHDRVSLAGMFCAIISSRNFVFPGS